MDEIVLRSMAKWPDVPAVYGWLELDRRGKWRLRGEVVAHAGAAAFIGRNYQPDAAGAWYFQNGPQRVFVTLDYTPVVYFLVEGADRLRTHTGVEVEDIDALYLDEGGALLVCTRAGPGLLYAPDLSAALDRMAVRDGSEDTLEAALESPALAAEAGLAMRWRGALLPVRSIASDDAPRRLGYVREPVPPAEESA